MCTCHDKIFVHAKRLGDDVTWLQCTCHDEALVLVKRLGDEARDDHLRTQKEADLFLDEAVAQHAAAQVLVGEVNLRAR